MRKREMKERGKEGGGPGAAGVLGHTAPFLLWIAAILLLWLLDRFWVCPRRLYPWCYAVKSVVCAALFLALRPWRLYGRLEARHLAPAVLTGLAVAALWIAPELPATGRLLPGLQRAYYRWFVLMPGSLPEYYDPALFPAVPFGHVSLAYSPEEAGWGLTVMKLIGSAGVIAVIEEFFFRGFLYRWLRRARFWEVPPGVFDAQAFWTVVAVFGFEHDRWLAGCLAGAAYGWLAVRTGGVWAAALAHGLTNLLLGIYVIVSRQYGFW